MYKLLGRKSDVEFKTSLSMSECQTRLLQELHHKRKIFWFKPLPPIVEEFNGNGFLISRNHSFFYRDNYFALKGNLEFTNDGTLVHASFRLRGILEISTLGFILMFGILAYGVIFDNIDKGVLLLPLSFWGFTGLTYWFSFWINKSYRNGLVSYLQSILPPISNSDNVNSKKL